MAHVIRARHACNSGLLLLEPVKRSLKPTGAITSKPRCFGDGCLEGCRMRVYLTRCLPPTFQLPAGGQKGGWPHGDGYQPQFVQRRYTEECFGLRDLRAGCFRSPLLAGIRVCGESGVHKRPAIHDQGFMILDTLRSQLIENVAEHQIAPFASLVAQASVHLGDDLTLAKLPIFAAELGERKIGSDELGEAIGIMPRALARIWSGKTLETIFIKWGDAGRQPPGSPESGRIDRKPGRRRVHFRP